MARKLLVSPNGLKEKKTGKKEQGVSPMPMLAELRRNDERSPNLRPGRSNDSESETVELDARSELSPSEMVERKLQATLNAKRERTGPLSSIPR